MTQETKDVAVAGLATVGSSMLTLAQVNEVLQTVAYVLTISITAYKFYWSIRRSIIKYREEKEAKKNK